MHPAFTNIDRIMRLDWMNQAACAKPLPQALTPANWYPGHGEANHTATRNAIELCHDCPVNGDCLVYALINDRYHDTGIYGGLTHKHRRRLRHILQDSGQMPIIRQCTICGQQYAAKAINVRRTDACCSPNCRRTMTRRTAARRRLHNTNGTDRHLHTAK